MTLFLPSTVTTWQPSTAYRGHRHAFTARCVSFRCGPSRLLTMTVHAPQPPSPHPNFVPVSPSSADEPTWGARVSKQSQQGGM